MKYAALGALHAFGALVSAVTPAFGIAQFIDAEAIDNYPMNCGPLNNNIANMQGFQDYLQTNDTGMPYFTKRTAWTNADVWTGDWQDGDVVSGGDDHNWMDRSNTSFAYFSGHGTENGAMSLTTCNTTATCPARAGRDVRCIRSDTVAPLGRCVYSEPRALVILPCNNITYDQMRWGESAVSGSWAGAGTNGGANFVLLDISFGVTPEHWMAQTLGSFAGARAFATVMPTRPPRSATESTTWPRTMNGTFGFDDTADVAGRGYAMSWQGVWFPTNSVGVAWLDAMASTTGGSNCLFGGGNEGIHGCGANIVLSADISQSEADSNVWVRDWGNYFGHADDATGLGWMSWGIDCNYDCNTTFWGL